MIKRLGMAAAVAGILVTSGPATAELPDPAAVVRTYADIALAAYEDSLAGARRLREAVVALVTSPSEQAMEAARQAWVEARVPYMQTEVYRFGNPIVDAWEGKVNAWPLDEGLIDYVDASYGEASDQNPGYAANVIASRSLKIGSEEIDASTITKSLLADTLQELGGIEANVATGYHAIEFLLWGQDLNGTGPGAGERPWTDYSREHCTNGNCDRRGVYLLTATDLLIDDLASMVQEWSPDGAARRHVTDDPMRGLAAILTGLGSLSYGELAGERMKLGLMLHDPEEEHDCFSDNTHESHYYDVVGMLNVYSGTYTATDGRKLAGPGLAMLVTAQDPALAAEMYDRLRETEAAMHRLKRRAETTEAYDQMIAQGNAEGNAVVQAAIDALVAQTRPIERIVQALGLEPIALEGSDSLDDPAAVFK